MGREGALRVRCQSIRNTRKGSGFWMIGVERVIAHRAGGFVSAY